MQPARNYFRQLTRKLLFNIIIVCFCLSAIVAGISIYLEYQEDLKNIRILKNQIEKSIMPSLTKSVWALDEEQIQLQLKGIINLPNTEEVILTFTNGSEIKVGDSSGSSGLTRVYPLIYSFNDKKIKLGELKVKANLDKVLSTIKNRALQIFGFDALMTFFVAFLILLLLVKMLVKPLRELSKTIKSFEFLSSQKKFSEVVGRKKQDDEIDDVITAIDKLQFELQKNYSLLEEELDLRAKAEVSQQELITKLEARNEEMERFSYTAAHDLKSPLITISGFSELLKQKVAVKDYIDMEDYLERIEVAAKSLGGLLDDLLNLTKVGHRKMELGYYNLREIAEDVLKLIVPPDEKRIKFLVSTNMPRAICDRQLVLELYQNLIGNSLQFVSDEEDPVIEIGHRRDEHHGVIYYVKDNGIGIDSKYQDLIFDMFQTLNEEKSRTGIGLAIVKRIVGNHNGRVWVESEGKGRGSCFCFTLGVNEADLNKSHERAQ